METEVASLEKENTSTNHELFGFHVSFFGESSSPPTYAALMDGIDAWRFFRVPVV